MSGSDPDVGHRIQSPIIPGMACLRLIGTVALRLDLIAMQEIFPLIVAPAVIPPPCLTENGSYWSGWVGRHRPGPEGLRRPALEIAQRNSAVHVTDHA